MPRESSFPTTKKMGVMTSGAPMGLPFSPGIRFGQFVFVSGQGPIDSTGKVVAGDIREQTRLTLENFKRVVEAGGSRMDDVLQTTVYLKDVNDFSGMNEVYSTFFPEPRPARATLGVADLLFGMKVEIQGVAYVSLEQSKKASRGHMKSPRKS